MSRPIYLLHRRSSISFVPFITFLSIFFFFLPFFKVILAAQIVFGIFPVRGLRHSTSDHLEFSIRSFSFIYSMAVQLCIIFVFSTSIYKQLNSKMVYTKVGNFHVISCTFSCNSTEDLFVLSVKFVFFFLNFLVYFNFTIVARKWPQYVRHWERAEQKLLELHIMQHQDQQVQKKIWKIAIVIMVLALSKFISIFFIVCSMCA